MKNNTRKILDLNTSVIIVWCNKQLNLETEQTLVQMTFGSENDVLRKPLLQ